jgi:hypothetical protein
LPADLASGAFIFLWKSFWKNSCGYFPGSHFADRGLIPVAREITIGIGAYSHPGAHFSTIAMKPGG